MNTKLFHILILCLALALLATLPVSAQGGAGIITFQGQLADANGEFLTGAYNLRFTIYDAETGGTALWGPETHNSAPVSQGQFVVQLGSIEALDGAIFDGAARWLEMAVWNGAAWEPLSPRLLMGGAAYALSAGGLPPGTTISGSADGVLTAIYTDSESGGMQVQNMEGLDETPPFEPSAGVVGKTDSYSAAGVKGLAMPEASQGYGGYFRAYEGTGVYGQGVGEYGVHGVVSDATVAGAGVFGESLGVSGNGVFGTTDAQSGAGVRGVASSKQGQAFGVWGRTWSSSAEASGVYGWSSDGKTYGVMGETTSNVDGAAGVYGEATAPSGGTFGGYFTSKSADGAGVYAEASSSTGTTYGVYATTKSTGNNTAAVQGWADASDGRVYGVHGSTRSSGEGAAGVLGANDATSGTVYGGRFLSKSTSGRGVYGEASAASGATYGVYGKSNSGDGAAVYGEAGGQGVGVKARSEKGNVFEGYGSSGLVFKVDNSGNVFADGTYQSPAADFAEMLPGDEGLEPGDVLAIAADGRVTKASAENPLAIIGVYSTAPAFLGGRSSADSEQSPARVPVAILGVVPVKVSAENGPIRPNDPLAASSIPGYAARAIPLFELDGGEGVYAGGSILGRALEGLDSGEGVIQVLLQLR